MASITHIDNDWAHPNSEFQIISANVDILKMEVLDHKLGHKYVIKCDSITEWIKMAQWKDISWMLWIEENNSL